MTRLTKPRNDGFLSHMKASRPCRHPKRFAVDRYLSRARRVLALLFVGSPAAVRRRVVSVVVNALQRVARRRSLAHVGQEGLKGFTPPITHRYPSTTVPRPVVAPRVCASRDHAFPSSVFWRAALSMCASGYAASVPIQTPATQDVATTKRASSHDVFAAAVALAKPANLSISRAERPHDDQPTESLAAQVGAQACL